MSESNINSEPQGLLSNPLVADILSLELRIKALEDRPISGSGNSELESRFEKLLKEVAKLGIRI